MRTFPTEETTKEPGCFRGMQVESRSGAVSALQKYFETVRLLSI